MTNCLLTGANGFLGKILLKELEISFNVFTLSKSSGDYRINLEKFVPDFNENFEIVVHAAGLAHINPVSPKEIDLFNRVNVIGTKNLINALTKSGAPKKLIFISSVAVYGEINGSLIEENNQLKATDPYGKSKIDAENLLLNWSKKHNVLCTILRLPLVVGTNPPGNLASMIDGIKKGYYFNISGGHAKKSMVLALDVAKFLLKAAQIGGVFNLTDGYNPSFKELSIIIAKQHNKKTPCNIPFWLSLFFAIIGNFLGTNAPINLNKLKKITSELTFNDSKARKAFGWDPMPVIDWFDSPNSLL